MPLLCHKFGFESLHDWRKFAGSFIKMSAQRKLLSKNSTLPPPLQKKIPNALVNAALIYSKQAN